jgi:1,4-dihydroxy-2-naphthoate octaprenyltransferase
MAMVRLGRPFVVVAGLIAFFTGASMAFWEIGGFDLLKGVVSLVIMITAILMAHYANEYADFETDSLTRRTRFSGGSGILPAGRVPRSWALWAAIAFLSVTILLTASAYFLGIVPQDVVVIVAIGLVLGWCYSMPPLALERTSMGEIDNAFLGGYLMPLMGYVPQVGHINLLSLFVCVPLFLAVLVNLLTVHWPDREADEAVGKRTLVVRMGKGTVRAFEGLIALMMLAILSLALVIPWLVVLLTLVSGIVAIWAVRGFRRDGRPQYGSLLMASVMILMGLGFIIEAVIS